MGNVSPIEVLWLAVMFVGVTFVNALLVSAILDNKARRAKGLNGEMGILARGAIRDMVLLGVALKFFASVGIVAALLPDRTAVIAPGTRTYAIARFSAWWSPLAFFIGGGLLVIMAGLAYRDKWRLLHGDFGRHEQKEHDDAVHIGKQDSLARRGDGGGD